MNSHDNALLVPGAARVPSSFDHLVYGVPSLGEGIDRLEELFGVRAALGGKHTGRGTHNALLGLGGSFYLELIAPDPAQPEKDLERPRPFGVHENLEPGFVGWAISTTTIDQLAAKARGAGYDPGEVQPRERLAPDRTVLSWRLTANPVTRDNFLLPFVIDWMHTPHPSWGAPHGVRLVGLQASHPTPEVISDKLSALDVALDVSPGSAAALTAWFETKNGIVRL